MPPALGYNAAAKLDTVLHTGGNKEISLKYPPVISIFLYFYFL